MATIYSASPCFQVVKLLMADHSSFLTTPFDFEDGLK